MFTHLSKFLFLCKIFCTLILPVIYTKAVTIKKPQMQKNKLQQKISLKFIFVNIKLSLKWFLI